MQKLQKKCLHLSKKRFQGGGDWNGLGSIILTCYWKLHGNKIARRHTEWLWSKSVEVFYNILSKDYNAKKYLLG